MKSWMPEDGTVPNSSRILKIIADSLTVKSEAVSF